MTLYASLLELVRRQVATARGDDVDAAIALMDVRQRVLDAAAPVSPADWPLIEEVLALDRELAGFIRQRMLRIRDQSLALQRGQTAMRGYGAVRHPGGSRLNTVR
jgi:hypothetical protein